MEWSGFVRPDGRAGARNHVAVIYTVECARVAAERIAAHSNAARVFGYGGCYENPAAEGRLEALATHPNTGAALFVSLGCECTKFDALAGRVEARGTPVAQVVLQRDGGTMGAVEKGAGALRALERRLSAAGRERCSPAQLTVGIALQDPSEEAGRLAGAFAAAWTQVGGTALIPAHVLAGLSREEIRRYSASADVADRLGTSIERAEGATSRLGLALVECAPAEGLAWLSECKIAGTSEVGRALPGPGLYAADLSPVRSGPEMPAPVVENLADGIMGLAAHGAQVVVLITGAWSVEGCAAVPVVKVCVDPKVYLEMEEEFDLGAAGEGAEEMVDRLLAVASGEATAAERSGNFQYWIGYR